MDPDDTQTTDKIQKNPAYDIKRINQLPYAHKRKAKEKRPISTQTHVCIICNAQFSLKENVISHHLRDHANTDADYRYLVHLRKMNEKPN